MTERRWRTPSVGVSLLAAVLVATAAARAGDAQVVLDKLRGLNALELAAAVRQIGAEDPDPLPAVLMGLTFWLQPRVEQAEREQRYPNPQLESAMSAAGRALAALGPARAAPIARCAVNEGSDLAHAELCSRALAELGGAAKAAVPILKEGLRSESSQARWGAMAGLVGVDGPAYSVLIEALSSPRVDVREAAAEGLGRTGSPVALKPLLRALEDPEIAPTAARAIGDLGPVALPAVTALLASEQANPSAVARIGPVAIPVLLLNLESGTEQVRRNAALTLAEMGEKAAPSLVEAMRHPSASVRRQVAEAVGDVPEAAPLTRTGLGRLATDPDPGVRVAAVMALGGDHESDESRAAVVRAVDDINRRVSWQALQTLGRFRSSAGSVRPVLVQKVELEDRYLRAAAIAGLVQLQGSAHPDQVAPILERIRKNDPDAELRTLATAYLRILLGARAPGQAALRDGVPPPPPPPPPAVPEPPLEPDPRGASTVREVPPAGGIAPPRVLRAGGTIKEPRKIKDVRPVYPDIAYQARVEGDVVLECTMGTDGTVSDVKVVKGIPLLDQAAIDAVSQWVYEPVRMDGAPVAVIMTVTVGFRLK